MIFYLSKKTEPHFSVPFFQSSLVRSFFEERYKKREKISDFLRLDIDIFKEILYNVYNIGFLGPFDVADVDNRRILNTYICCREWRNCYEQTQAEHS